jgi:hypothetical protein
VLEQLFQHLYQALSRDPLPRPGILVRCVGIGATAAPSSYWVTIRNDHLYGTPQVAGSVPADGAGSFVPAHPALDLDLLDLDGNGARTLRDLVNVLNATPGFAAQLADEGLANLWAAALVDGSYDIQTDSPATGFGANQQLPIYGSLLWAMLKPIAWSLRRSYDEALAGLRDSQPSAAYGMWLNSLGDLYGVDRLAGESDAAYKLRLYYDIIAPRCNNVAMAQYLNFALGLADVTVTDDPATPFKFDVNLTLQEFGGLGFDADQIRTIVERIKAWGVVWALVITAKDSDVVQSDAWTALQEFQFKGASEDVGFLLPQEQFAARMTEHFTDPLRRPFYYLVTNISTLYQGNTWDSRTNDWRCVLKGRSQHFVSWVALILDTYHDSGPQYTSPGESFAVTAITQQHAIAVRGGVEDATRFVDGVDATAAHAGQRFREPVTPRWPALYTNRMWSRSGDPVSRVSAKWPSSAEWVRSVGEATSLSLFFPG